MDPSGRPSPRREVHLQGPRPARLNVSKDSHKIRKQPQAPFPAPALPPRRPTEPVIIYAVSPKVIHIEPREFMSLVQRLTGPSPTGAVSPAAKFATIERAEQTVEISPGEDIGERLGIEGLDRFPSLKGILSPVPSGLPGLSPGIFSPTLDASSIALLNEMSPFFRGSGGSLFGDGGVFASSPGNFLSTPVLPSPGTLWDFMSPP